MGSTSSRPSLSEKEKAQKRALEKNGVLVPPSFGVGVGSESLFQTVQTGTTTMMMPIEAVRTSTQGYRILNDYTTPGFTLFSSSSYASSSSTTSSTSSSYPYPSSSLAACMMFPQHKPYDDEFLRISHGFSNHVEGNLDFHSNGRVDISSKYHHNALLNNNKLNPYFNLDLTKGIGIVGFDSNFALQLGGGGGGGGIDTQTAAATTTKSNKKQEYYKNDPFKDDDEEEKNKSSSSPPTTHVQLSGWSDFDRISPTAANGFCAIRVPGCTLCAQAKLPLDTLEPTLDYHFSCQLSTSETSTSTSPMIVDIYRHHNTKSGYSDNDNYGGGSSSSSTLRISQVVSMDRLVLNPLETRCPTIRNTLGWAVEMHRSGSNNNNSNKPILTAGLAYQLNRSVAIKVIGGSSSSSSHGLTGVVTLKRWQHPRMTASILVGNSNNNQGLHFRGLAFELELGGSSNHNNQNKDGMDSYYYHGDEDAEQNNSTSGSSASGPPPPPLLPKLY